MRHSKELKVGLAIILSVLIFVFGIRFFDDLPLFRGTYQLNTSFKNAQGLLAGSNVRVNGVDVGKVDQVTLNPETQQVLVVFHVDEELKVPQGSYTGIEGIEALGSVSLGVTLGPSRNPDIKQGGFVPSREDDGALAALMEQGPALIGSVDSLITDSRVVMRTANRAMTNLDLMMTSSNSEINRTLAEYRATATAMNAILRNEQQRIAAVMTNLQGFSGNLNRFSNENMDSLSLVIQNMNQAMARASATFASLQVTADSLALLMTDVNNGEGSIGQLLRNPSLYNNLDSTAASMNRMMADFQRDPRRYLRHLTLVRVF